LGPARKLARRPPGVKRMKIVGRQISSPILAGSGGIEASEKSGRVTNKNQLKFDHHRRELMTGAAAGASAGARRRLARPR
jgi:hypothetical protein